MNNLTYEQCRELEKEYNKVKVIDSMMGTGKTTMVINMMKNDSDSNYIFITPYLSEIERVKESLKNNDKKIYEPKFNKKGNKLLNLHEMIKSGKNICSTHSLFQRANNTTRSMLASTSYKLILDEVMDVVSPIPISKSDFKMLKINKMIKVTESNFIEWNVDDFGDYNGKFNDIKDMAMNKSLMCYKDSLFMWNFPIDIFEYFDEVYILTYLFECQLQKYYYDYHKLNYKTYQIDDNHKLIPFSDNLRRNRIKKIKNKINIYYGKMNFIGEDNFSLSKTWYEKNEKKQLMSAMQRNIDNFFRNIHKQDKGEERMWTCFRDYKSKLKGRGYTKSFVSLNCRATNDYIKTKTLAYASNRFINPIIKNFYTKNILEEIQENKYALSELLQWIWRSRIRTGQSIDIYIPSKRMRNILVNYLNGKLSKDEDLNIF